MRRLRACVPHPASAQAGRALRPSAGSGVRPRAPTPRAPPGASLPTLPFGSFPKTFAGSPGRPGPAAAAREVTTQLAAFPWQLWCCHEAPWREEAEEGIPGFSAAHGHVLRHWSGSPRSETGHRLQGGGPQPPAPSTHRPGAETLVWLRARGTRLGHTLCGYRARPAHCSQAGCEGRWPHARPVPSGSHETSGWLPFVGGRAHWNPHSSFRVPSELTHAPFQKQPLSVTWSWGGGFPLAPGPAPCSSGTRGGRLLLCPHTPHTPRGSGPPGGQGPQVCARPVQPLPSPHSLPGLPPGSDSQWRAGPACDPGPPTALLINLAGFSSVILVHSFTNIHSANLGPALCRALGLHDKACAAVERAFIKCLLCAESCAGADTGTQQRWGHTWFLPLQRWQSSGGDTRSSLRALQCRALRNA